MPCWNKIETGVDLKNPDMPMLKAALTSLGYAINGDTYTSERGNGAVFSADHFEKRISVRVMPDGLVKIGGPTGASVSVVNELKRAYSTQVVKAAAARFGWNVQKKSERQFVAQRRF